ncbi:Hypothetical_protein [Hexamita inflata]|uniref:Hypothetical_protein n=1 Tax=Hexamita inflata TaxID=28002 RepID=A0AA86QK28_9EUKA|nr:Hypothetical protein HINF_LOCUS45161 [Hexamita inflata]
MHFIQAQLTYLLCQSQLNLIPCMLDLTKQLMQKHLSTTRIFKNMTSQIKKFQQQTSSRSTAKYSQFTVPTSRSEKYKTVPTLKSVPKFRASLASKKNYISAMLNNQIMMISQELNLYVQFIQNSNSFLD